MTSVREILQNKILRELRGDALCAMRLYAGFLKGAKDASMAIIYLLELAEHLEHLCRHYMVIESIREEVEAYVARQQAEGQKRKACVASARSEPADTDREG